MRGLCPLHWLPALLALLLMNDEVAVPGLDLIIPDITKPCPMFFAWSAESARRAGYKPLGAAA